MIQHSVSRIRTRGLALLVFMWIAVPHLPTLPGVPASPGLSVARAQAVSELPRAEYYVAREMLGAGATLPALEGFEAAFKRARQVGQTRWIDSIPPLVMAGECYYRQGNLPAALQQYDQALQLAIANPGWVDRLDIAVEQLPPQEFNRGVNWFSRPTNSTLLSVPESVQLAVDPLQAQQGPQGGVVAPVSLVTRLDIAEVLYTMGLALRRRSELLGPLAQHSAMADSIEGYFVSSPQHRVPWLQASWQILRGLSRLPKPGLEPQAINELRSGVLVLDRHHHYLSSLALEALAELEIQQGRFQSAAENLQVANLLAAQFEQHIAFEETARTLAAVSTALKRDDIVDGLAGMAKWSLNRSPVSACAAQLGLANYFAHHGSLAQAEKAVAQAAPLLRNRDVMLPKEDARLKHTQALIAFLGGKGPLGKRLLAESLSAMQGDARTGAIVPEIYQAQLTLNMLASQTISDQVADDLLVDLMGEPGPVQWQIRPLDTLARITTSSMPAYERLLELAIAGGASNEIIFSRMDRLQRQRFYESLPLGGRLTSLRFAVNQNHNGKAQPAADPVNVAAIKLLLDAQPGIAQALDGRKLAVEQLVASKVALDDRKISGDAKKQFASFVSASDRLEAELAAASLKRIPMNRHLPEEKTLATVQESMQAGELFVSFAMTTQSIYGIGIRNDAVHVWQLPPKNEFAEKLKTLFTSSGVWKSQGRPLPSTVTLPMPAWREAAVALRDALFSDQVRQWLAKSNQLVVAPHAALWYVPFEILPVGDAGSNPIIGEMPISYLPMLGVFEPIDPQVQQIDTAIGIVGRFFATDLESNEALAKPLIDHWPGKHALTLDQKNHAPSAAWLRLRSDVLWSAVVLPGVGADTVLSPLGASRQQPLSKWLEMGGFVPSIVVAPGMQSSIESRNLGDGSDLFLPACELHFSGVRSALLSRWAVGGESTADLLLRYFEELSAEPPPEAMRRATVAIWGKRYLVSGEPALMPAGNEAATLTNGFHPVLWSGYITIGR